jgi:hypothetical protein
MILERRLRWGLRYPMLLSIAAFYPETAWSPGRYHVAAEMSAEERRFVGEVVADFVRSRPALLLVDEDPPTPLHGGFRYLDYFGEAPSFARAFVDYERVARTPSFVVYRRRGIGERVVAARP